ncbi:hypothetical protein ACFQ7W_14720 [Streptomyces niveus]|uniref:hypothetical protein n=1 Tax=Streptomyces niveus TaxID=193462 RepID=UPI00368EE181
MSLADLTFDRWRALDRDAAHRLALEAARSADGRLVEFDGAPHPGMAEFLNGPEGEDMGDEFGVRPVLDLG